MSKKQVMRAIKEKCLDCSGGYRDEVKNCPIEDCPLFIYRLGKDPNSKKLTDEQKAAISERFMKARESKGEVK